MIHKCTQSTTQVEIWPHGAGDGTTILYTDLVGDGPAAKANDLRKKLQATIDVVVPITDLPPGDSDGDANPNKENNFWDWDNLIARHTVVKVTWKADAGDYTIEFKRAEDVVVD